MFSDGSGNILAAVLAATLPVVKYMIFFHSGLVVILLVFVPWVPESPGFLLAKRRYEDLHKTFDYISRLNGQKGVKAFKLQNYEFPGEEKSNANEVRHRSISEILQIPERRANLFILVACWTVSCFSFYLIAYNV